MKDLFGKEFKVGQLIAYARISCSRLVIERRKILEVHEKYLIAEPLDREWFYKDWNRKKAGKIQPEKCVIVEEK